MPYRRTSNGPRRARATTRATAVALLAATLLAATLMAALPAVAAAQAPFPGLDQYVTQAMRTWKVPGLSIAIVRNDSVLYTKGFGVVAAGGAPVNDRTLFEIGSSTKAFTATLIAMLVTDGKMHYDDRMTQYLPSFALYDPVASAELTIRDALTHRSGLARGELAWLGSSGSRDDVLHRLRFLKPESPFRSRWSYQNMMYLAAGQAAGVAGGSSWDDLVKRRILGPLGMTSTLVTWHDLPNTNIAMPHGITGDSVFEKPRFNSDNIGPAGSIISSARDMAQWLRFQLNDGTVGGTRLVSSAALRETHTPQIVMGAGGGGGRGGAADSVPETVFSTYGMGWMVEDYHRQLMWQHGGNTDGMTTAVGMLPEHRFGVVVLSNMNGSPLPALLMHYIFDRQLGLPVRDLSAEAYARSAVQRRRADSVAAAQMAQRSHSGPPAPLSAFVGTYADSLYGEATVALVNGTLELTHGLWHGPLEYWNANNFRWTILPSSPTGPMFIKFEVSPEGRVTGLYYGLGADATLLGRKETGGGRGRGRGAVPPPHSAATHSVSVSSTSAHRQGRFSSPAALERSSRQMQ
jgi:CubicO group peptidase (beta-lactamase class C family)